MADRIQPVSPSVRRCGPLAFLCLQFAWVAALIAAVGALVVGVVALLRGELLAASFVLLIACPVSTGHFVAFGLVIRYAERRP